MKTFLSFVFISGSLACSSSSSSKNGWDLDAIEGEIEKLQAENKDLKEELNSIRNEMTSLKSSVGQNEKSITEQAEISSGLADEVADLDTCLKSTFPDHITECLPVYEYACLNPITSYENWRLPRTDDGKPSIEPEVYDVNLNFTGLRETDKAADGYFYFDGVSNLQFVTNEDICSFQLHIEGYFWIENVQVQVGDEVLGSKYEINSAYEYLTIATDFKILTGTRVNVKVIYSVQIPEGGPGNLTGIYVGKYLDENEELKYLLSTQFEPTGARRVFPCLDEPSLKAKFRFTMTFKDYDGEFSAIFNTEVKNSYKNGDLTTNEYHETMRMPTYLLAILISPYYLEAKGISNDENVSVRILGRAEWKDDAQFALEEAMSIVDGMSRKFGLSYCHAFPQMPCKSDQTGIPQYAAGAMENWGLITYKEYLLFFNEQRDDFTRRRSITSVIGHEIIHQWFGNTVTCPWWDEIYINEAFGSIGGYLGLIFSKSHEQIDYQWEDEYMGDETFLGLIADGLPSSRPMVNNANNGLREEVELPSVIQLQFDTIAYQKSGSVMMMIRALLGDDLWTKGLRNYLQGQIFETANWSQILSYWDEVVLTDEPIVDLNGMSVTEIMEPYFRQMGYPVLKIVMQNGKLEIRTSRFMSVNTPKDYPESSFNYQWHVPLILEEGGVRRVVWLLNAGETSQVYEVEVAEDVVINPEANIWCRINFDRAYVTRAIEMNLAGPTPALLARNIAKMMQDHYRMFTAEAAADFDVSFTTLLDMSGFLGNGLDKHDGDRKRWIHWREMSNGNILSDIYDLMHSYLGDKEATSAEAKLLQSYREHFYKKVESFIGEYYPDKLCGTNDPSGAYDLSKARIVPFLTKFAFDYAPTQSQIFTEAVNLAQGTVQSECAFIQQSPDTRQMTFESAIAHESGMTNTPVSDYLAAAVNSGIDSGINITDIVSCTNKDPYNNDPVSLYRGDCMLNVYFQSLANARSVTHAVSIMTNLRGAIQPNFALRAASNAKIAKDLLSHFQQNVKIDEFFGDASQISQFIANTCSSLSSQNDKLLVDAWNTETLSLEWRAAVERAVNSCLTGRLEQNNLYMQKYYAQFKDWVCLKSADLDCANLSFEENPFVNTTVLVNVM